MSKKYYWETNSAKERTVFIKSLITLYIQTFEGHVPELVNWDLSLFYLDERSYQRAVITNRPGSVSPIKSPTSNFTTNTTQSVGSVPFSAPTERTRRNEILNKAPYSSNSTLNEVNKRYELEQQQQQEEAELRRLEEQKRLQLQKENEMKRLEEERRIKQEERKRQMELEHQRQLEEEERKPQMELEAKKQMELKRQRQFEEEQRLKKRERTIGNTEKTKRTRNS
ncbi:CRE_collapsed_G0029510.mRNA.1.CDS.1 [Saccharomyces cerevisiae]|nr:CRE_collapsed_G0029510.mRNA.1.CDS.1 [Saccharomyces cerevisiae]